MSSTVWEGTDGAGEHTPGHRPDRRVDSVLQLLVVPLVGRLALIEQLTGLEATGGLGVAELLGQRVIVAGLQVLRQVFVLDTVAAVRLVAGVRHAHRSPADAESGSDEGETLLAAGEVLVAAAYGVGEVLARE